MEEHQTQHVCSAASVLKSTNHSRDGRGVDNTGNVGLLAAEGGATKLERHQSRVHFRALKTTYRITGEEVDRVRLLNITVRNQGLSDIVCDLTVLRSEDGLEGIDNELSLLVCQAKAIADGVAWDGAKWVFVTAVAAGNETSAGSTRGCQDSGNGSELHLCE